MTATLIDIEPIVVEPDMLRIPNRPYDFNKGDRRFEDRERALEHARLEAILTGVRQAVRLSSGPYFDRPQFWLVQAIGS